MLRIRPQRVMQKGPCLLPVALDGSFGDAQQIGNFAQLQTTEEPQFDDAGLSRIQRLEMGQRLMQCENVYRQRRCLRRDVAAELHWNAAISFRSMTPPEVIDHDVTHRSRRDTEKVLAVDQLRRRSFDKPQVRLVDEGGWRERFSWAQPGELPPRQRTQVVIDQREYGLGRRRIATLPVGQSARDVRCCGHQ